MKLVRCLLLIAAAVALIATPLQAATLYWVNSTPGGDINTPANWTGGTLPNAGDTMWIGAVAPNVTNPTAVITADYTNNATPPELLYLGNGAATNATINHSAGGLTLATGAVLGANGGQGTYNMTGGTLTMNAATGIPLTVGAGPGSTGSLTLSSGASIATLNYTTTYNNGPMIGDLGGTGSLTLGTSVSDTANFSAAGNVGVGRGAGSNGTLTIRGSSTFSQTAGLAFGGGLLQVVNGNVSSAIGGTATINIQDSGTLNVNNFIAAHYGGNTTMTMTGGFLNISGYWQVANSEWAGNVNYYGPRAPTTGVLTMTNAYLTQAGTGGVNVAAYMNATGTWNIGTGSQVTTGGTAFIAQLMGNGTVNMTGNAIWTSYGDLQVANSNQRLGLRDSNNVLTPINTVGLLDMRDDSQMFLNGYMVLGGTNASAHATVTLRDNAVLDNTGGIGTLLAYYSSTGTLNLSGGPNSKYITNTVWFGGLPGTWTPRYDQTGVGQLNLNGGTLVTGGVVGGGWNNSDTVSFNSGLLQLPAPLFGAVNNFVFFNSRPAQWGLDSSPIQLKVQSGGMVFDGNGNDVAILEPLQHGGAATDGGLTMQGSSLSLTLTAASTMNGPVAVNAGTLKLGRTASLATTNVSVAQGAGLELGSAANLGALANLNLASGSNFALALTASGLGPNAIATALMPNTAGINWTINAQGNTLDTVNPYTIISGFAGATPAVGLPVTTNMRAYSATATVNPTNVQVQVSAIQGASAANLTWAGANVGGPGMNWDVRNEANWTGAADNKFWNLDNVTFDDMLAQGYQNVNVVGTVHPGSITIKENGLVWNFTGPGRITSVGAFNYFGVNGAVSTINPTGGVDLTGNISINTGTLEFGPNIGPTVIPGNVTFSTSTSVMPALNVDAGPITFSGTISDTAGCGIQLGSPYTTVTGGSYAGGGGTIVITNSANPITGPLVLGGGGLVKVSTLANGGLPSSIGSQSADPANLVLSAKLYYTGPATTWDRGFTAQQDGGISTDNNLTLTGNVVYGSGNGGTPLRSYFTFINGNNASTITLKPSAPPAGVMDFGSLAVLGNGGTIVFEGPAGTIWSAGQWRFAEDARANANTRVVIKDGNTLRSTASGGWTTFGTGIWNTGASNCTLEMYGNSRVEATNSGRLFFGVSSGSIATSTVTMNDSSSGYSANDILIGNQGSPATFTMNGSSSLTAELAGYIGNDGGWDQMTARLTMNNSATYTVKSTGTGNGALDIGRNRAIGIVTLNNSARMHADNYLRLGYLSIDGGGYGRVILNGTSQLDTLTVPNGTFYPHIGVGERGVGILDVNDSATVSSCDIYAGYWWYASNTSTNGTVNVNGAGATVHATNIIYIGGDGATQGTWNQNGGHTTADVKVILGEFDFSSAAEAATAGHGTLNLNGGVFTTPQITTHSNITTPAVIGPSFGTVNFNGGKLQASAASADFIATDDPAATMTLKVLGGGAKIDSNGFDLTITKALNHAGGGTDGGLEKIGAGKLILTGALGYNGPTLVSGGTLTVNNGLANTLTTVSGPGTFHVATGSSVTAASITVNSLVIGGAAAAAAVPEPGTLTLLALAGMGILLAARRRK